MFVQVTCHTIGRHATYNCCVLFTLPETPPLGAHFYDLEKAQWVSRGKNGKPIRPKYNPPYWCNVVNSVATSCGRLTREELEQSYRESDDTLTEWDLQEWERQRTTWLALDSMGLM
jgi:hypothetical protein